MDDEHSPNNVLPFPPTDNGPDVDTPIYDLPQLVWQDDGRCTMIDRDGHVMVAQTGYLNHLSSLYARETYRGYARNLLDISRVLACYSSGKGLPLSDLTDGFLVDRLRPEYLVARGVQLNTFKRVMMVLLRFLKFAQQHGFIHGVIGSDVDGPRFRINLPLGNYADHPVMNGRQPRNLPRIPSSRDFGIVEAETLSLILTPSIKRQLGLITKTAKLGLRRSELVGLSTSLIPTTHQLAKLRSSAESGRGRWSIPILVKRAKGGGERMAHFPIALLEELRAFIDTDRPHHLKSGVVTDAIFVSTKTGEAYKPSYITNIIKRGARKAAAMHSRSFGELDLRLLRPHHYRHRACTDMIAGMLRAGMDPLAAVLNVMDVLGITSFETVSIYLHLAQAENDGRVPPPAPEPPSQDTPHPKDGSKKSRGSGLDLLIELANAARKNRTRRAR